LETPESADKTARNGKTRQAEEVKRRKGGQLRLRIRWGKRGEESRKLNVACGCGIKKRKTGRYLAGRSDFKRSELKGHAGEREGKKKVNRRQAEDQG